MNQLHIAEAALKQGNGILRLVPVWVPRVFCESGNRTKLNPRHRFAFGTHRGSIDERWLSSTTLADNGPLTTPTEGLSYIVFEHGGEVEKVLLRDAVGLLGPQIIGERMMKSHGRWPMYSKFFDNFGPLPLHVHPTDEYAALTGKKGKPEAYFFPWQMNITYPGERAITFFGLDPDVDKKEVRECLKRFTKGDNEITTLSRGYQLKLGTGWYVPAGVLHAPGSICTYEPQEDSDVFAMWESVPYRKVFPTDLLWKDTPPDKVGDLDFLIEKQLVWEENTDPHFRKNHYMEPIAVQSKREMKEEGFVNRWICYKAEGFSANELTVLPGRTVTLEEDDSPYGLIMLQGHGTMNGLPIETPSMIGFEDLTHDEYFVTAEAAKKVEIANLSKSDPIVMLRHYGPGNKDLAAVLAA